MTKCLTLTGKEGICEDLAIFKFKSPKVDFKPGQWITIAAEISGKKVPRVYSIASAPYQLPILELFVKQVIKKEGQGIFTSKLFSAKKEAKFEIIKIGGNLTLNETDKRKKILVSSGTGIAPYISMIRHEIKRKGKSNSIIVYGASYIKDLGYKKELEGYEKQGKIIKYIPTISRPEENPSWKGETGRAEGIIQTGKLSKILREEITKEKYVIYACGHPGMVDNIINFFKTKSFEENKDIKFEKYWVEPKKS